MRAHNFKDLTGQTFERLTVIEIAETRGKRKNIYWKCVCSCGNIFIASGSSMSRGSTKSCGCIRSDAHKTHGMTGTPEFLAWYGMKSRCYNENTTDYNIYGGRGIEVCKEWRDDFSAFFSHVGKRPSPNHSIDRINTDGNYEPGNVRWETATIQSRNQRIPKNNTSGAKGVYFRKKTKKFAVVITVNKRVIYIGQFATVEEAAEARKKAEEQYWKTS